MWATVLDPTPDLPGSYTCRHMDDEEYPDEEDRADPKVAAVLAELSAKDSKVAEDAEAALSWMLADGGPASLTQEQVQLFCWYQLPYKWACELSERFEVLEALARALELLDMPRYAAICRSQVTGAIIEASEVSYAKGMAASKKADQASGLRPPGLDEFAWGSYFGTVESNAYSDVSAFLELAVASGELVPGARGFKAAQQKLARSFPSEPRGGSSLLDQVRAERLDTWLADRRSSVRRELFAAIESEPRKQPTALPRDADPLPRMRWLLEQFSEGEALTKTGNLNRALVQRAAPIHDWDYRRPPQSEDEITELWVTHGFIQRCKLTRRSGSKRLLSSKGKRCLGDPKALRRPIEPGQCAANSLLSSRSRPPPERFFLPRWPEVRRTTLTWVRLWRRPSWRKDFALRKVRSRPAGTSQRLCRRR